MRSESLMPSSRSTARPCSRETWNHYQVESLCITCAVANFSQPQWPCSMVTVIRFHHTVPLTSALVATSCDNCYTTTELGGRKTVEHRRSLWPDCLLGITEHAGSRRSAHKITSCSKMHLAALTRTRHVQKQKPWQVDSLRSLSSF